MHRAILFILAIMLWASAVAIAQVQPGSIGGTVGKKDKSLSGSDDVEPQQKRRAAPSPQTTGKAGATACEKIAGSWKWAVGSMTATVIVGSDGSAQSGFNGTGKWTCKGAKYTFV